MSAHSIRNIALMLTVCMLAISLLCLPAYALPSETRDMAAESTIDPPPIAEGIEDDALFPNTGNRMARGNLGDTDGDGKIEGENNAPAEKDPIDAIENMTSQSGGWITVAACIAAIIALVLIIVALIPKKRM